jgi:hypothetical protein
MVEFFIDHIVEKIKRRRKDSPKPKRRKGRPKKMRFKIDKDKPPS